MNEHPPPQYVRVYQTWNLLRRVSRDRTESTHVVVNGLTNPSTSLRHSVQMARVERGLSIQELSAMVRCSPETLSAFEIGDEVLSDDLQKALKARLNIDGGRGRS